MALTMFGNKSAAPSARSIKAIALIFLLGLSPWEKSSAQMMEMMGMMGPARERVGIRTKGSYHPPSANAGPGNSNRILSGSATAQALVFKGENDSIGINALFSAFHTDSNRVLPQNNISLPHDLKNISFGTSYSHNLEPGKYWGLTASYGSASDRPFSGSDVQVIHANIFYGFPSSEWSNWILLLNYSNNRAFLNNIPLPGFAYIYRPSPTFRGIFGIPFAMIDWKFSPGWSLAVQQFGISKSKAELAYAVFGPVQTFVSGEYDQQPYLRAGRSGSADRLTYDEKRLLLGIRSPLSALLLAEISGGHAFDRSFFEASRYSRRNDNRVRMDNGMVLQLQLSARF